MDKEDTIINSALALPIERRADLADRLLDSLTTRRDAPDAFSDEVAEEVQRRSAEMDRGLVEGVSWNAVREGIDQRLGERSES